ncbi:hypothetical protein GCM10007874_40150 [Labrys miyagiensis]|uniref:Pentapeptide MXKDX repeat protein n=1 Tax=Labrys miyagiensis TaxID=346912 RepID=A0ABQ6CL36_9HYPH|nr:hypothetical protein [Labrys miyagiensis]GLS20998.1 hypothetical protein GCM10007874_40150 [Labrys miyagiensis]
MFGKTVTTGLAVLLIAVPVAAFSQTTNAPSGTPSASPGDTTKNTGDNSGQAGAMKGHGMKMKTGTTCKPTAKHKCKTKGTM